MPSRVAINDEPDGMQMDMLQRTEKVDAAFKLEPEARKAAIQALREQGLLTANRVRLGTTLAKSSALTLSDASGKPRLMLMVTPDGKPSIQFLDDKGKPAKTIDLDTK